MIDQFVFSEYKRLRRKGYTATDAMRAAKVWDRWTDLQNQGYVRMVSEPEYECHDDSYVETWGIGEGHVKAEKKRIADLIEREGLWMYATQYRTDLDSDDWQTSDSIGDMIGNWRDTGYDIDLMSSCIRDFDAANASEANTLASRATFAGVAT